MIRKIKYLFILIITLSVGNNIVLADTGNHIVNLNKKASVTITLKDLNENIAVSGAKLSVYQIATVNKENNNLKFNYLDNFKNCNGDLTNLTDSSLTSTIDKCINNKDLPLQTKLTNESGIVKFDNLQLGLYLVKQTNKVSGFSNIDPFLVVLPKEENNNWIYDIKAYPKTDIIRLIDIIVEKKWDNINNENTPEYITVQLLKGEEVIDTITLNNKNNWTYTWYQIEQSDIYSVKEIDVPKGYTDTYRQVDNKFIITNTKTLVQTGQNILLIEILTIIGLSLIVLGILLDKRNNHE